MLMVITGGVAAVLDVIVIIFGFLGDATSEEAFALLSDNVGNVAALGLEVVLHHPGLIFAAIVLEHRIAFEFAHTVGNADGLHLAAVHVHADLGCAHVDVAIENLAVAIHHGMVAAIEDDTVLGIELDHVVQVNPLEHKSAGITCGTRPGRNNGVALCLDNRVHRLGQIDSAACHHLTMRQERQQCHHRHQCNYNM